MAKIIPLSFQDAIDNTANNRSILLGNGFSISLCESFNYQYLYKEAQKLSMNGGVIISENIKEIFKELKTNDFEKVLAYLNITQGIGKHYPKGKPLVTELQEERTRLIKSFLNTINSIHPQYKCSINTHTYISCLRFLSKFNNIFTTNYDLLLYWIIMERDSVLINLFELEDFDMSSLPIDDGFKRGSRTNHLLIWDAHHEERIQNIFYLHGSLFIIEAGDQYLKIDNNKSGTILEQLEASLNSGRQPLIVLEGSSKDKTDKIYSHSYLRHCLNALKNLTGDLFLLGFSINDKADKQIIESIQDSKIERIYIGYYTEPDEDFKKKIRPLSHINNSDHERELFLFNSQEAVQWETIKQNSIDF